MLVATSELNDRSMPTASARACCVRPAPAQRAQAVAECGPVVVGFGGTRHACDVVHPGM
jgi:hypothetical protein